MKAKFKRLVDDIHNGLLDKDNQHMMLNAIFGGLLFALLIISILSTVLLKSFI